MTHWGNAGKVIYMCTIKWLQWNIQAKSYSTQIHVHAHRSTVNGQCWEHLSPTLKPECQLSHFGEPFCSQDLIIYSPLRLLHISYFLIKTSAVKKMSELRNLTYHLSLEHLKYLKTLNNQRARRKSNLPRKLLSRHALLNDDRQKYFYIHFLFVKLASFWNFIKTITCLEARWILCTTFTSPQPNNCKLIYVEDFQLTR